MNRTGNWTGPVELRTQLQRLWERGDLLAELLTDESSFPRRLSLKGPSSGEMSEQFDAVRKWIAGLRALPHYRIELREFRHRVLGINQVPAAVWVDSLDDALAILGKRAEAGRVSADLVAQTRARRPVLLDWLAARPHKALALANVWGRLLDVVDWLEAHPRPNLYLRQVDIPGVDSKFIEAHRGVLMQWLDLILPADAIDASTVGVAGFARRYGFREKPERVRLRALDPAHALLPGAGDADLTLDASTFAGLQPSVTRVFITENEINFLAFPPVADSLLIFGAGYGFDMLAQAGWLRQVRGLLLGRYRYPRFRHPRPTARPPSPCAFATDGPRDPAGIRGTLGSRRKADAARSASPGSEHERALYDELRDNRIRPNLRLEQERIGFGWVERAVAKLGSGSD